jgi:hypothetical protein
MRKGVVLAVSVLVTLGVAFGALAAEKSHMAKGVIGAIDTQAKTLTLKVGKTTTSFAVADDAQIMAGGKNVALAGLKVGQRVEVKYTSTGAGNTATSIMRLVHHTAHHAATAPTTKKP